MAMEAQEKLTDFEEKIKNIGLDNNLVKNFAELFNKKAWNYYSSFVNIIYKFILTNYFIN